MHKIWNGWRRTSMKFEIFSMTFLIGGLTTFLLLPDYCYSQVIPLNPLPEGTPVSAILLFMIISQLLLIIRDALKKNKVPQVAVCNAQPELNTLSSDMSAVKDCVVDTNHMTQKLVAKHQNVHQLCAFAEKSDSMTAVLSDLKLTMGNVNNASTKMVTLLETLIAQNGTKK